MPDDIRAILESALTAPSVHNCQPWRWHLRGNTLELWREAVRDCPELAFNVPEAQLIAFGMAIETACIAASAHGYQTKVYAFPDPAEATFIARVELTSASITRDPLYTAIAKRATNRDAYMRAALSSEERAVLEMESAGLLQMVGERRTLRSIAYCAAYWEYLLFSNRAAHHFAFSHLNWLKAVHERKRAGIHADELAIGRYALLLRLGNSWSNARVLGLIGMKYYARVYMAMRYMRSSAFGFLLLKENSALGYLEVGRRAQRLWLAATNAGLALQPVASTLAVSLAAERNEPVLTARQRAQLSVERERLHELAGAQGETIGFMFRVGHAPPPTVRSLRLPLQEVVEVIQF